MFYTSYVGGTLRSSTPFWTELHAPDADWTHAVNERPLCFQNEGQRVPAQFTFCQQDFDASGETDFGDLACLLIELGSSQYWARFDLDETGEIDMADVALLLLSLGPCSPCTMCADSGS